MVLDFGKGSLFRPSGLEQDTGVLRDRWGQDGSEIKNFSKDISTSGVVVTVTAGKRLFVSSVIIAGYGSAGVGAGQLKDGSGGSVRLSYYIPSSESTVTIPISTPLYFDTELYYNEVNASVGTMTLQGWEEDAP